MLILDIEDKLKYLMKFMLVELMFLLFVSVLFQKYTRIKIVSHTYANFVEVPIPLKDDEEVDPCIQKVCSSLVSSETCIQTRINSFLFVLYAGGHFQRCLWPNSHQAAANGGAKCVLWYIFHHGAAEQVSEPSLSNLLDRIQMQSRPCLVHREDPYRVMDYRNGPLMAVGSRDLVLHLFYVACELKPLKVLKGHVGSIRSVLLCEDKHLVITGSLDSSIRWGEGGRSTSSAF